MSQSMFRPVILSPTAPTSHSDLESKYFFFEKRAAGDFFCICAPKKYNAQGDFHVKSWYF